MCEQHRQSLIGTSVLSCYGLLGIVLAWLLPSGARAADQPAQAVLYLAKARPSSGEIRASTDPGVLRWKAAASDSPRDFAWNEVSAIEWPPAAARPKPTGDFRFELTAGDVLFGTLLALDDRQAELDVSRLGRIHVQRSNLHRIDRWRDGADLIYQGPNGLVGWKEPAGQKNWSDDSGRPMTNRKSASIRGDFKLPARARIEFEISWRRKADFVFALGVDDTEESVKRAFRFEAWGSDLIVQRELKKEADLNVVQKIGSGPGRSHFQVYLDQDKERILTFSPDGKQLSHFKVGSAPRAALPGLCLQNLHGDVRLDWLRISPWNGEIPREVPANQTRVHRADGSFVDGQLTAFDAAVKAFRFRSTQGESRMPIDQVSSAFLSPPNDGPPRMIRAVCHDGSRLSGDLVKLDEGLLVLNVPGIREPVQLPLAGLRTLVVNRNENHGVTASEQSAVSVK
jgi:hypothetical protein